MKMIDDWKRAAVGYAFFALVLVLGLLLAPVVSWFAFGYQLDPNAVWLIVMGVTVLGAVGRFVAQPTGLMANLWRLLLLAVIAVLAMAHWATAEEYRPPGDLIQPQAVAIAPGTRVTEAAIIQVAVPEIRRHEGVRLVAYRDPIGIPTICAGTIRGVRMGMTISADNCDRLIASEATEYWRGVSAAMTEETRRLRISATRGAAWTDLTINIGIGAARKSTAMRRINAGDIPGSCAAMTWFNKAGGVVWGGLVTRRGNNYDMCMIGVRA